MTVHKAKPKGNERREFAFQSEDNSGSLRKFLRSHRKQASCGTVEHLKAELCAWNSTEFRIAQNVFYVECARLVRNSVSDIVSHVVAGC